MAHKTQTGFSLVEVAIAMTIAGFMIVGLFNLQGMLFKTASNNVRVFNKIVEMKNFFYSMMRKELPALDDTIKKSVGSDTMTYIMESPGEKSVLKKIENLVRLEINYTAANTSQRLVSFVYYPQEKEKPGAL